MKTPLAILGIFLLALSTQTTQAASLRDQLALATDANDTYARIELMRRILDQEPVDTDLHRQLIGLWLQVSDYDMVEATVLAWKDIPGDLRASALAEVLYNRDRKSAEAIQLLDDYHAKNPADLEITRQLARYLRETKQTPQVVALLAAAPGVDQDVNLLVWRALARRDGQDLAGALKDFAAADEADSDNASVRGDRPSFERLAKALPGIQQAMGVLQQHPGDPLASLSLAYLYLYIGNANPEALANAKTAYDAAPQMKTAILLYAGAANAAGQLTYAEAKDKLHVDVSKGLPSFESTARILKADQALAANPRDVNALVERSAELAADPAQFALSLDDANAALAVDPREPRANMEKIVALANLGDLGAAEAAFHLYPSMKPPAAMLEYAVRTLAAAEARASHPQIALEYLNQAIHQRPSAALYKQRATIYQKLNQAPQAKADLAKAAALEKKASP